MLCNSFVCTTLNRSRGRPVEKGRGDYLKRSDRNAATSRRTPWERANLGVNE